MPDSSCGRVAEGDLAPEKAQNEGITHGMKMAIVLIVRVLSSRDKSNPGQVPNPGQVQKGS